jgi:hypothetical protein
MEIFEMWWWRRMEKISWIDTVINEDVKLKVKIKYTLEQATKSQRGSRGIALPFL